MNKGYSKNTNSLMYNTDGTLSGGFSGSIYYQSPMFAARTRNKDGCIITNNCQGANCGTHCDVIKNPFCHQ